MSHGRDTRDHNLSFYDVLQVSRTATLEEIRRSYQTLALQFHPDKRKANDPEGSSEYADRFIRIDEAWKTLRDERLRRIYDAELMQRSEEYFVNEILTEADFVFDTESSVFFHTCRCGGYYILPEEVPSGEPIYVSCDECSLIVQVNATQTSRG
uniref:J domain-containing protein n=1 Tax=Anopheles christyi TaxID=43041 RepID=A0A182JWS7_9DIPT